jgi:hypothetical protein
LVHSYNLRYSEVEIGRTAVKGNPRRKKLVRSHLKKNRSMIIHFYNPNQEA